MKKLLYLSIVAVSLSCGSAVRTMSGATEGNLKKQVSVEQGCPIEKIEILDSQKAAGNATYSIDVCGKRMVYRQIGSVFMEKGEADELLKQ